ncbi:mycofactocin-coupled SDR family oxidoreductase [Amycolatopsis pithecellobii]|uniref:Mycofactocin-coupled SDR family oxidoreductase n=1 Tax=Amycolatopsis pithecellobii TaxID=664692 RepID=A0A6N7Z2P4_9PSEU|nr:mycofactocin-coupled SDR family oxidoreductase [Amycolatopsis pithecellobii]MTD54331.1 mycofactocin-coupled SDR family oxidoreductase [Amycolatopsis pithecellobii]
MTGRLEGKVAFITGAARGLGRSHAVRLAEEGADIIAVDLCATVSTVDTYPAATTADLDETIRRVEKLDRRIVARVADVRDSGSLAVALDEGIAELGGLDITIANAGIVSFGSALELTERQWQDVLDINLTGVWNTARTAAPHLVARGGGALLFVSSIGGLRGMMNVAHYVSAKHAIVGLMRTMANELAPHRVRVNTVHPTNVDTEMIQNPGTYRMFAPDAPEPTQEAALPAFVGINALEVPWVEPVDISNALLFLASDEARYVTGVTLPVDAGAMIK